MFGIKKDQKITDEKVATVVQAYNPDGLTLDEYLSPNTCDKKDIGRPQVIKEKRQMFKGSAWITETAPVSLVDELIPIFQPVSAAQKRWGQVKDMFVGRRKELKYLCNLADELSSSLEPSRLAFISAESGCGKSSVIVKAISMIRKMFLSTRKHTIIIKHVGNNRDYMVPFR